ncbi:MAG: S-layer homology domain-containing protein [Cyanobacteria bacterium P01_F01_bin.56]
MYKFCPVIGLSVCSVVTIAHSAIANTAPSNSMATLPLPALTSPLPAEPAASGQQLTQMFSSGNFTDVSSNHWAFTAVNTVAEDYNCLSGYADGTFRGDEFVTRDEFAAGMDACLDSVVRLIEPQQQADTKQILNDLEALSRELGSLSEEVEESEPILIPE